MGAPGPGDVGVCESCGTIFVYTVGGGAALLPEGYLDACPDGKAAVLATRAAILQSIADAQAKE